MLRGVLFGKDLPKLNLPENECDSCRGYDEAAKRLPVTVCPHCGAKLYDVDSDCWLFVDRDERIVGTDNGDSNGQVYRRAPIGECPSCKEYVALVPTAISWNANHDIHYTGSGSYIPGDTWDEKAVREAMQPQIDQYLRRTAAGEKIEPWLLALWCARSVEHFVAEQLKKMGLT